MLGFTPFSFERFFCKQPSRNVELHECFGSCALRFMEESITISLSSSSASDSKPFKFLKYLMDSLMHRVVVEWLVFVLTHENCSVFNCFFINTVIRMPKLILLKCIFTFEASHHSVYIVNNVSFCISYYL